MLGTFYFTSYWKTITSIRQALETKAMTAKWNIIAPNKIVDDPSKHLHCHLHPGVHMSQEPGESMFRCDQCGAPYQSQDLEHDVKITSKYSKHKKALALTSKPKKKITDQHGNEVPDDMAAGLTPGQTIQYYHEQI